MGNASAKQSNHHTTESQISPETPALLATPSFSNGELGQLQEILYGAQQRSTLEMIATLQTQVNDQIQTLGNMLNSRINKLTESVEQNGASHEQKLTELESQLQTQLKDTQASLTEKITDSVDQLQSNKLDRTNLAQMLSDVSERLSKADDSATR